jgi:hypothetical protein
VLANTAETGTTNPDPVPPIDVELADMMLLAMYPRPRDVKVTEVTEPDVPTTIVATAPVPEPPVKETFWNVDAPTVLTAI